MNSRHAEVQKSGRRFFKLRGFALLEVSSAIALGGVLLATIFAQADFYTNFNKALATARYQRAFANAAQDYWENTATQSALNVSTLSSANYLPARFAPTNGYGQSPIGCFDATANDFVILTSGGGSIPADMQRQVMAMLGPAAYFPPAGSTLCGVSASGRPAMRLTLKTDAEKNGYLLRAGGTMYANLSMAGNDLTITSGLRANIFSATSGAFQGVETLNTFAISSAVSASLISVGRWASVTSAAYSTNTTANNILSVTQGVTMGTFKFSADQTGTTCPKLGAIAPPADRTRGMLYCGTDLKWKELSTVSLRFVQSAVSRQTTQTAWCDPGEVVVSGGGNVTGSYGQNMVLVSSAVTKTSVKISTNGVVSKKQIPYTKWFLDETYDEIGGNIKGNIRVSRPVVSNGVWGWRIEGTNSVFNNTAGKSSASAVCMCVGVYANGVCTWDTAIGGTRPTTIESATNYCTTQPECNPCVCTE